MSEPCLVCYSADWKGDYKAGTKVTSLVVLTVFWLAFLSVSLMVAVMEHSRAAWKVILMVATTVAVTE